MLEYCLSHPDTDPLHRDKEGRNTIHYAVTTSYPKAIPPTLQRMKGVVTMPMDITDSEGKTPLHVAAERGDSEMIEYLLTLGATATLQDLLGNTCLHHASSSCDHMSVTKLMQREDLLPHLRDIQNGEMQTALHLSVMHGNTDILNILLRHGSDKDIRDSNGRSPLHTAVLHGNMEAVDVLFTPPYPGRERSEVHVDNYGDSPLGLACLQRSTHIVKFLIENGANAKHLNGEKESTLMLLVKRKASEQQSHTVLEIFEALKTAGAFVNVRSLNRNSAMSLAIDNEHTEIAKRLVNSMTCIESFHGGNTALHLAIQKRMISVINLILPNANVNTQNDAKETPLHTLLNSHALYANLHSHPLLEKLTNSRSLTITDREKRTPLLLAVEKGLTDVAKWLITQGSSVNVQNVQGNTILHILAKNGNTDLLYYLFADNKIRSRLDVYKENHGQLTAGEVAMKMGNMESCRRIGLRPKPTRVHATSKPPPSRSNVASLNQTSQNTGNIKHGK